MPMFVVDREIPGVGQWAGARSTSQKSVAVLKEGPRPEIRCLPAIPITEIGARLDPTAAGG